MPPDPALVVVAQFAARLIVEEGVDYASARQMALAQGAAGRKSRSPLTLELIEDAVREHIALFHADTQPLELQRLRACALRWMRRLAGFRPHLAGAVWRGTATRQSCVQLDLYVDDPKTPEYALIESGVSYDTLGVPVRRGEPAVVFRVVERDEGLRDWITIHLQVHDPAALHGALKPDARGRSWRGDAHALEKMMEQQECRKK